MPMRNLLLLAAIACAVAACSHTSDSVVQPVRTESKQSELSPPNVKFFTTQAGLAWPEYICSGPDHALWFTEYYSFQIARITTDGIITEFRLPSDVDVEDIVEGADGNLWWTAPGANRIGRLTPRGVTTAFAIDDPDPNPRGITLGPDGNVWFTEYYSSKIGRITPDGKITQFIIPDAQSYPWKIATGPDGDLWFTESANDAIGRFDPRTLTFKRSIKVPTPNAEPWGIREQFDHQMWFTERYAGKIGVVANGKVVEAKIAQQTAYPDEIASGPDHILYFSEQQFGAIGRFNPATGKFLPIIQLPTGSIPTGIVAGPDNNIWFTASSYTNKMSIGEIVLN